MPLNPRAAMLLAALLWSTSGLLIKVISLDALPLAGWRSGIAGATLLLVARVFGFRAGAPRTLRSWLAAVVYALIMLLFVAATKVTAAANVIFLQYTAPIYILILEPFWIGTRFRWSDAGFVALALAGMSLFFTGKMEAGDWGGNAMALGSGVAFALFALMTRAASRRGESQWDSVVWGNFLLFGFMLVYSLSVAAGAPTQGGAVTIPLPSTAADVLGILFLGVVQIGLAYALFMYAIARLSALETMLLGMLEPVLNPVWVYLGTGESPSAWALLGGALIITSITARTLIRARDPLLE
jgi:DME family drug/metabolite transporter